MAAALAVSLALSSVAAQACELDVRRLPEAPRIDYDVYAFDRAIGTTEMQLVNTGDTACEARIRIEGVGSLQPPIQFDDAGISVSVIAPGLLRPSDAPNVEGRFMVMLDPGETRDVQLDFFTDQTVSVPAGTYERDISIKVLEAGAGDPVDDILTQIVLVAGSRAQVNIAGTDGIFDKSVFTDSIDFGEPELGEMRRLFLQARSNSDTTITLRSEQGGAMKHTERDGSEVGYKVVLDGQELDLRSPVVLPGNPSTGLNGRSQPMEVIIDRIEQPFAGQYRDRLVVTIEAR